MTIADYLPTPNLPLLRKVLDHIDAHPEEWVQHVYSLDLDMLSESHRQGMSESIGRELASCGTAFCIAGHAVAMTQGVVKDPFYQEMVLAANSYVPAGEDEGETDWFQAGQRALGLTLEEAAELFSGGNNRQNVQIAAEAIAARAGERL